jgi:hypothetical protein
MWWCILEIQLSCNQPAHFLPELPPDANHHFFIIMMMRIIGFQTDFFRFGFG